MLIVAIIGVSIAIAIPNFSSMLRSNRISANVNTLVAAFNMARTEALKRGINIRISSIDSTQAGNS